MAAKRCYGAEEAITFILEPGSDSRCQTLKKVMMKLMRRTFLMNLRMKVIVMELLMKAIVIEVLIKTKIIKIMMKIVTLRKSVMAKMETNLMVHQRKAVAEKIPKP